MDANIKVEYYLNQMVNSLTGQKQIRQKELERCLFCLIYGKFPDTVRGMIRMELVSRLGSEQAVEMLELQADTETGTAAVISSFRRKMESGDIKKLGQYYVPVVFLADQLDAGQLQDRLSGFAAQMERMGSSYELCYYCIFNYETMDAGACREQLQRLLENDKNNTPMCICTQDCLADTEYQKYLKAVQSMAMHMFLEALKEAGRCTGLFAAGCWKLDMLKQKAAGFLMDAVQRQEENLTETAGYDAVIQDRIEKAAFLDEQEWTARFRKMPVNYQKISGLFHAGILKKRPVRTYREVLGMLYGKEDAFRAFVNANLKDSLTEEDVRQFFSGGIGNLHAVTHKLEDVLCRLKRQYGEDAEKMRTLKSYDDICRFEKKKTIRELVAELENAFWRTEAAALHAQRKEQFTEKLLAYVQSQEFQETLRRLAAENKEVQKRLSLLRQEAFMAAEFEEAEENGMLRMEDVKIPIPQKWQKPDWNADLFEEDLVKEAAGGMMQAKSEIQDWMEQHAGEVLGRFAAGLHRLKMNHKAESYYSARMSGPAGGRERESLYIGLKGQDYDVLSERLEEIARLKLPNVKVYAKKWETDMCFELFAVRDLQSFDEVYGMGMHAENA